jgi:hypothetical protein
MDFYALLHRNNNVNKLQSLWIIGKHLKDKNTGFIFLLLLRQFTFATWPMCTAPERAATICRR